ncbi:hypothetical protein, partial [Sphingomonas sp. PP-CE-3G-477]|uniref:hypothetical protein n=1 Tax=Sphingomonas sp. PP-CE-3G-477 TaxID=2135660 RepID=UPI001C636A3F
AKTEKPIDQHLRPAASCFGGYRTSTDARFPSQLRTLRTSGQLTNSGRLFMSTAITTLWNDVTRDEAAIYGLDSERHIAV